MVHAHEEQKVNSDWTISVAHLPLRTSRSAHQNARIFVDDSRVIYAWGELLSASNGKNLYRPRRAFTFLSISLWSYYERACSIINYRPKLSENRPLSRQRNVLDLDPCKPRTTAHWLVHIHTGSPFHYEWMQNGDGPKKFDLWEKITSSQLFFIAERRRFHDDPIIVYKIQRNFEAISIKFNSCTCYMVRA